LYAEILTDFTTRNSERANTSLEKVKILNYEKHGPLQNRKCTRMLATGKQIPLLIRHLTYTVMFDKSLCSDRGKKTSA
jgi:hypothetical protein